MLTFQDIILKLNDFWKEQGCVLHHSYDGEVGAGTFHPATFIRSLGPEPYCAAYTQLSRRPTDGRYGENPNRLQRYFQYQVILKPVPRQFLTLYFKSLAMLGINGHKHDVRLVHDDWQSPTLGAKGLGWEVWLSGMEVSQITYFQQVASIDVPLVTGEITYGLERLALFLQGVDSVYDIRFNDHLTYGDIYLHNEQAHSKYNFELASVKRLMQLFTLYENEAKELLAHHFNDKQQHTHKKDSPTDSITTSALPSYDLVIKCSHLFNLLDARSAISAIERDTYIARIRTLAKQVAENYLSERKAAGFPLTKYIKTFSEKFNATPPQPAKTLSPPAIPPNPRNVDPARKNSLLIEIGVEELPHETLEKTEINFHTLCTQTLVNHALTCSNAKAFSTPRRLAFLCQLEQSNNNPPHEALLKPIEHAIQQIFEKLPLKKSNLGETMRWGTSDETEKVFIRPITYILILLNNDPIEFSYAGITNAPITRGHRWLTPGSDKNNTTIRNDFAGQSISINNPNHWEDILADHYVIADRMKRQSMIEAELTRLSERNDWEFVAYHKLLPVVTQLIEYPIIIIGEFAEQFLTLPEEVIVSELVEHQKYFPIRDRKTQKLLPRFIITSNIKESNDTVKTGNERVLTARLRDGLFFYENDLKNLAFYRTHKLQTITYYEGIGSYQDKVSLLRQVLKTLIENYSPHGYASIPDSNTISTLCDYAKIDIASQMVAEFPHLQGVIGSYYTDYALRHNNANNLKPDQIDPITDAIKYQYVAPNRLLSELPEQDAMLRYFFALADRLTHLIPLFAVGIPVTGSKDPKGIRRAVIEIADLLLGGIWVKNASTGDSECYRPSFSFKKFWTANPYLYEPYLKHHPKKLNANQLFKELLSLLNSRLPNALKKEYLKSKKIPPSMDETFSELLKSVLTDCDWNPLHSFNLLRCIIDFRNKSPVKWLAILTVHKRISHILTREKKTITDVGIGLGLAINETLLGEGAEYDLFAYYQEVQSLLQRSALQSKNPDEASHKSFNDILELFGNYEQRTSKFFDNVMVNDKNQSLKVNRLTLLDHIKSQLDQFLDWHQFS
ncbi:glycine--tRNA ligase [Spirochaetota bacterium]|nr:glycine--tRNA ligase [Spirochaetota bacterium]